ncbi:MAG: chloride channel protein, partial [Herbaspirillum sp.]
RVRHDFIFPGIIAAITSFEISKFWGVTYDYYPANLIGEFSEFLFIKIVVIGILCGLVSWLFVESLSQSRALFRAIQQRFKLWPPLVPLLGGLILSALIIVIPTDYLGLSLPVMHTALLGGQVELFGFLWKTLLVVITLGSGFYGGIVTPQFVIGALAGNTFATMLGVNPALGAAVGMVSVVASASNTPIAAILMSFELFGNNIGPYFASACVSAYIVAGNRSVYSDQLLAYSKSLWLRYTPDEALTPGKIRVSREWLRKTRYFRRRKSDK